MPASLPASPHTLWTADLAGPGIGGIAVAENCAVVISRDALDSFDVVQAFDAATGKPLWKHVYEAKGSLDYGNSARATPLIKDGCVFTLGAFGDLCCLELESGIPLWRRNVAKEFSAKELTWGHSGSPLIVDGKLIVQPGGPHASLVALDPDTGETIWTSSGGAASYSSFVPIELGDQQQIIGFDFESLGAWDIKTGKRLWKHVPARAGDFNVPTVLIQSLVPQNRLMQTRLIVSSENNGTRMMGLNADGSLQTKPLAQYRQLAPDTHTPVLAGVWVVGISNYLHALNTDDHFQTVRELEDAAFEQYCSLVGTDNRLLAMNMDGELLLIELTDQQLRIISRWKLETEPASVYSHPAVADIGVYVRLGKKLVKLELLSTESSEK